MSSAFRDTSEDLATLLSEAIAAVTGCSSADVSVQLPESLDLGGLMFHVELGVVQEKSDSTPPSDPGAASTQPARQAQVASSFDKPPSSEELDEEADAAADFLEGLLDAFDLPGDLRIRVLETQAEVEIADVGTGALIGRRGQTLDAMQELARCSLQRQFQRRSHVQIDAEGYRARRKEKLLEKAAEAVETALDSGEEVRLEPMDVFERKAVHEYVASIDGVISRSHGREPGRRVVIAPE